jgi:hypothetical protein
MKNRILILTIAMLVNVNGVWPGTTGGTSTIDCPEPNYVVWCGGFDFRFERCQKIFRGAKKVEGSGGPISIGFACAKYKDCSGDLAPCEEKLPGRLIVE